MNKDGKISQVESNIYYMDPRGIGLMDLSGIYIVVGDGLTIIETAGSLIIPQILKAVKDIGYREKDIRRSIVTHIHLDHAGGAGSLVRLLPWMKVYVHGSGARHLLNPSKLIKSAEMVYGNREKLLALHGEIAPVPKENLIPISNTNLDIGFGTSLRILDSPGHATHHLCLFHSESGCLFSGEALGHYYPESDMLTAAVAPPGFDLEASKKTIRKIEKTSPKTICFSQYGQHRNAAFVIDESIRLLDCHDEYIKNRLKQGLSPEDIIEEMLRNSVEARWGGKDAARYMVTSTVLGFVAYNKRRSYGNNT